MTYLLQVDLDKMSHNEPSNKIFERERIVFEIIKNNLDLHHNALMKLIVPEFMAKNTFEKTRDLLLEKKIIFVRIKGNMKFYAPMENYEQKLYQFIEHSTNSFFHDLKLQIKRLEFDFPRKDIDEKISEISQNDSKFTNEKNEIKEKTWQYQYFSKVENKNSFE